jgi:hypothetical protein
VNLLIELSPKLLETSIRYGNNIAIWANKVETRYKEFFNVMSKVQQTYGLQTPSTPTNNSSLINASTTSSTSSLLNSSENSTSNVSVTNEPKLESNEPIKQQEILKQNEQKQKLIRKRQFV